MRLKFVGKKRERSKKASAARPQSRLYDVELLKEFSCKSCYTKTKKVRLLNGHKKIPKRGFMGIFNE